MSSSIDPSVRNSDIYGPASPKEEPTATAQKASVDRALKTDVKPAPTTVTKNELANANKGKLQLPPNRNVPPDGKGDLHAPRNKSRKTLIMQFMNLFRKRAGKTKLPEKTSPPQLTKLQEEINKFKDGITCENQTSISHKKKELKQKLKDYIIKDGEISNKTKIEFMNLINGIKKHYEDILKQETSQFIRRLDGEIKEDKNDLRELQFKLALSKDTEDKKNLNKKIESLSNIIHVKEAVIAKLEKEGPRVLHKIRETKTQEVRIAKSFIERDLKRGNDAIEKFDALAKALIEKTRESNPEASKKMLAKLNEKCTACRKNMEACKQKEPIELFGLVDSLYRDLDAHGELGKPEERIGYGDHVRAQVTKEYKFNDLNILPDFAKSFHNEIIMKVVLKNLDLALPGEDSSNLEKFKKYTENSPNPKATATALNDAYTELWRQYESCVGAPQKYLEAAEKFLNLFQEIEPSKAQHPNG